MTDPTSHGARNAAGASTPRSPLTLDDLTADLTWPKLLRIGRLSLRPARLGLAVFYLIGCGVLLGLGDKLDGQKDRDALRAAGTAIQQHVGELCSAMVQLRTTDAANRLVDVAIRDPAAVLREAPWATLVVVPLLLVWTVIMGGAITRSAATELAWNRTTSWPEALALSIRRWKSLLGAVVLPLAIVWIIAVGMTAAAWALFDLPVLKVIGALGWGLFLFGGLVVTLLSLGLVFGHMLLVPGVVCEGADTIDSVQHAYAMVFGKPLRLIMYLGVLGVQALVVGGLVALVIGGAVLTAQLTGRTWTGDDGRAIVRSARQQGLVLSDAKPAVSAAPEVASSTFVEKWTTIFILLGYGVGVSYWWCASTGLFLAMRRVCDGQEFSELWSPGMVEGTVAESAQGRTGPRGESLPGTAISEAVVDNGPADEG